jgi:hypothetical protein
MIRRLLIRVGLRPAPTLSQRLLAIGLADRGFFNLRRI